MEFIQSLKEEDRLTLQDMLDIYQTSPISEYEKQIQLNEFIHQCLSRYENEELDKTPKVRIFKEGDLNHYWDTLPLESLIEPFSPPEDIMLFEKSYYESAIRYEDFHHLYLRQSTKKCTKTMILEWDSVHVKPKVLSKLEGLDQHFKFIFHVDHEEGMIRFELPVFSQLIEFFEYSLSMGEKYIFLPTYIYWSKTLEEKTTHITYMIFDIEEFKYYYFDPNSNISHWESRRLFEKFEYELWSVFKSFKWSEKIFEYQFTSIWRDRRPLQAISPYSFDKGNCNIITLIFATLLKRNKNIIDSFFNLVYKSDSERLNMYYQFIILTVDS
jgi:hypothetical protein